MLKPSRRWSAKPKQTKDACQSQFLFIASRLEVQGPLTSFAVDVIEVAHRVLQQAQAHLAPIASSLGF
jgi:hypothetical protein